MLLCARNCGPDLSSTTHGPLRANSPLKQCTEHSNPSSSQHMRGPASSRQDAASDHLSLSLNSFSTPTNIPSTLLTILDSTYKNTVNQARALCFLLSVAVFFPFSFCLMKPVFQSPLHPCLSVVLYQSLWVIEEDEAVGTF